MTISRCITDSARIANIKDKSKWADEIAKHPKVCPYTDCSPGANCFDVVRAECKAHWSRQRYMSRVALGLK